MKKFTPVQVFVASTTAAGESPRERLLRLAAEKRTAEAEARAAAEKAAAQKAAAEKAEAARKAAATNARQWRALALAALEAAQERLEAAQELPRAKASLAALEAEAEQADALSADDLEALAKRLEAAEAAVKAAQAGAGDLAAAQAAYAKASRLCGLAFEDLNAYLAAIGREAIEAAQERMVAGLTSAGWQVWETDLSERQVEAAQRIEALEAERLEIKTRLMLPGAPGEVARRQLAAVEGQLARAAGFVRFVGRFLSEDALRLEGTSNGSALTGAGTHAKGVGVVTTVAPESDAARKAAADRALAEELRKQRVRENEARMAAKPHKRGEAPLHKFAGKKK